MPARQIRFFNRYKKTIETEQIYGEVWLRFTYENPLGWFFLWFLVKRAIFSRWYGHRMRKPESALLILPFISQYSIDVDEFEKSPFDYKTFNEFFYRTLKPVARPITPGENVAIFPADGRHLVFQDIEAADGFYVKGLKFSLRDLFGDDGLAQKFAGGSMVISRLCPVDYHRFHFPVAGVPGEARVINGWLYSVSPIALRRQVRYLVENKRAISVMESPAFGTVVVLEVGATNVGSIQQSFVPGRAVEKGDEKGLFAFGGSCVITLFQRGKIRFDADLTEERSEPMEIYAKMGDRLGVGL
ncbi:MAG: hypothetical protein RL077_2690 [Verrucomicrobiota bacterium]|jgi:phosphatidylserine decarboxylase